MPRPIIVHVDGVPSDGDGEDYLRFLGEELKPWVEREYRVAPFSVTAGCGNAGLMAMRARTSNPDAFGASVWINPGTSVSVLFETEWNSSNQSSDPHNGLRSGLESLFEGWRLDGLNELAELEDMSGWNQIVAHYSGLSERFGYTVVPDEDLADDAAGVFAQRRQFEEAIRLFEMNSEWHSGSARTFNHLGDAFRFMCRWEESEANYSRAFDMASEMSYGNVSNYEMELESIRQAIATEQDCVRPGEAGADRTEVQVSTEILETYVGEYALSSTFSVTITLEEGQLHAQATGQGKIPLFAESETKFFMKVVDAQISFTKDESGEVTGAVLHQNGREMPARRISN